MTMLNTALIRITLLCHVVLGTVIAVAEPAPKVSVPLLYLQQDVPRPPVLSNIQPPAADSGLKGAEVAIADSNTTGRFLNHHYHLQSRQVDSPAAVLSAARQWLDDGNALILAHLPATTLQQLSTDPAIQGRAILINVAAPDDLLRTQHCTTGLLHTLPSRSMLSDALAQFLVAKRWKKWLLISASQPQDQLFADALRRSAKRFGGKLVGEKRWSFDTDLRRTAQQELPLFTQFDDYDITLLADEAGDVGEYVLYNTWLPRPVAGTQGLTPVAWHRVVEQWGAIQLQNRFRNHALRPMNDIDYAAWLAVRAVAEAVTRTNSSETGPLYQYLLGEQFELAAFKGRKLNFRRWNGQLRQPIPLVHPRALVSQSPQIGFLHPRTELDTLGFDQPEVQCNYRLTL